MHRPAVLRVGVADDEGTLDSIGRLGFFEKCLEPSCGADKKDGLQLAGHDLWIQGREIH